MRWTPGKRSDDLEDRRGMTTGGGGIRGVGAGRMGLGGMVVLLILSLVFKQDFFSLVGAGGSGDAIPTQTAGAPVSSTPQEEKMEIGRASCRERV